MHRGLFAEQPRRLRTKHKPECTQHTTLPFRLLRHCNALPYPS